MYHDNFEFQSAGTSITTKGFQIDQSENTKWLTNQNWTIWKQSWAPVYLLSHEKPGRPGSVFPPRSLYSCSAFYKFNFCQKYSFIHWTCDLFEFRIKGSSDSSRFILDTNVGKSRIRHRKTKNLNDIIFNRFGVDIEI